VRGSGLGAHSDLIHRAKRFSGGLEPAGIERLRHQLSIAQEEQMAGRGVKSFGTNAGEEIPSFSGIERRGENTMILDHGGVRKVEEMAPVGEELRPKMAGLVPARVDRRDSDRLAPGADTR
jgi:hypothetical protein